MSPPKFERPGCAHALGPNPFTYQRRRPEKGVLYQVLAENLESFLFERSREGGLPKFVERELRAFLECGILAHGFARVRCQDCGDDILVAFSCKGRGFCPSCGARRMSDTAAHLVDHVFPYAPVRQWVLSLPFAVRFLIAFDRKRCADVRRIFVRTIMAFLRKQAKEQAKKQNPPKPGGVCFTQRFGSSLNLNVHFHLMVIDGAYDPSATPIHFRPAPPLDDLEVGRLVFKLRTKILRYFKHEGLLQDDNLFDLESLTLEEPLLADCYQASIQGRIAFGEKRGQKVPRLDKDETYLPVEFNGPGCAAADGFSLHANTRIALRDRDRLERLFRYAARPPIAQNRLRLDQSGKVVYFFRHAFRDGTTRIVLDPLSFIEKLAALIPAPKAHLVTYHGILAPASRLRPEVIPSPRAVSASRDNDFATVREERPATQSDQRRYKWAELLKRVFKIDILECEKCGGKRELIAVITQSSVIVAILDALDLPTTPPSTAPARASPFQSDLFS